MSFRGKHGAYMIGFALLSWLLTGKAQAKCQHPPLAVPVVPKDRVYAGLPYQAGEKASYLVFWTKLKAGTLTLDVLPAVHQDNRWYQAYGFSASTGDWFKHIYIGRYRGKGFVRPIDHGVRKFRLSVYRDPPFKPSYFEDKWIDFQQEDCVVEETIKVGDKPLKKEKHLLESGANDALGVFFRLRALDYTVGKSNRILVYSSAKNWWLDAIPEAIEKVSVPFGEHMAFKLRLLTYLGKDLQQKGDVFFWIAKDLPSHPILKIEAEVNIGSVRIILENMQNARPAP